MATLERFKEVQATLSKEKKVELYKLFIESPERGIEAIIELATELGESITKEEVSQFILEIDVEDEFMTLNLMKQHWRRCQVVNIGDVDAAKKKHTTSLRDVVLGYVQCVNGYFDLEFNFKSTNISLQNQWQPSNSSKQSGHLYHRKCRLNCMD